MSLSVLTNVLASAGVFFTLVGLLVFVQIFVIPNKPPMDETNRINHLRIVWFALKSPERLVEFMPWLAHDEGDIMDSVDEDDLRSKND